MPTVLFVCTANICRSPAAAALFVDWMRRQGVPGEWHVLSAGTWAEPGLPASPFSRNVLGERGIDLSGHRSRLVDAALLDQADLVLGMTRSQCEALRVEFPQHAERIHLLSTMAGPAFDISDPYGGPRRGYVAMADELGALLERGGKRIVTLAHRKRPG